MFIDMRAGDHIRLGSDITLVVLEVEDDQIQFALEGVDSGCERDSDTCCIPAELNEATCGKRILLSPANDGHS